MIPFFWKKNRRSRLRSNDYIAKGYIELYGLSISLMNKIVVEESICIITCLIILVILLYSLTFLS